MVATPSKAAPPSDDAAAAPPQEEYAPELLALMRNVLRSQSAPEDPLNPVMTDPLESLTKTKLAKLKADAFDALSVQLQTKEAGVELQTICNSVMTSRMNDDNVVRIQALDSRGRSYEHRYLKVFRPQPPNPRSRKPRSIQRKAKAMITVMNLLCFDQYEQQEVLERFACQTDSKLASTEEAKPKKRRRTTGFWQTPAPPEQSPVQVIPHALLNTGISTTEIPPMSGAAHLAAAVVAPATAASRKPVTSHQGGLELLADMSTVPKHNL